MDGKISKARELSKLAEKATQGPWYARDPREWKGGSWYVDARPERQLYDCADGNICRASRNNVQLIAAAPEMAKLLGEMADEIE